MQAIWHKPAPAAATSNNLGLREETGDVGNAIALNVHICGWLSAETARASRSKRSCDFRSSAARGVSQAGRGTSQKARHVHRGFDVRLGQNSP